MLTRQGGALFTLAQGVTFTEDFAAMRAQVLAGGTMAGIVATAGAEITTDEARYRTQLGCGTPAASPGCAVDLRYIQQVNRNNPPNVVFTFMVSAFELAAADHRTVALNLVSPEEGEMSIRDYRLHMRMLDYLRGVYPTGHITLHAGELVPGLVKPEELTYHIREAVLTGHAERIGHGVDALGEDNSPGLMWRSTSPATSRSSRSPAGITPSRPTARSGCRSPCPPTTRASPGSTSPMSTSARPLTTTCATAT
jgi:adenosine deaminase